MAYYSAVISLSDRPIRYRDCCGQQSRLVGLLPPSLHHRAFPFLARQVVATYPQEHHLRR
jgi:hypothetical protein